jgi:hypothetical protein
MSEIEIEREIARLEAGGNAWDDSDEVVHVEFRGHLYVAVQVRLPADAYKALKEEARNAGVGPRELAGRWLIERLRVTGENRDLR